MGNANISELSSLQRFQFHEEKKDLLINGFCRSVLAAMYDYKQFDFKVITHIVIKHYAYTINTLVRQIINKLAPVKSCDKNYYLLIALEISKMLIESHKEIRKQFQAATKERIEDNNEEYYNKKKK
eukprot:199247_1